jgi:hypothetical protein
LINLSVDYFLIGILSILTFGLVEIVKRIWLPAELQFEEMLEGFWEQKLGEYFKKHDLFLKPLGYFQFLTMNIANLQTPNAMRIYTNPMDPAIFSVNAIGGLKDIKYSGKNYVSITTHFEDGTLLTTRNVNISSILEIPTRNVIQDFPGEASLEKLKQKHDLKVKDFNIRNPIYLRQSNVEKYLEDFRKYHKEFCELNQSKGLLRFDISSNFYRATYKTGLRGVVNYLNPLVDNFTWKRFALTCLAGFVFPLVGSLFITEIEIFAQTQMRITGDFVIYGFLAFIYSLGGISIGLMFTDKSFIWGFILGYVPCRLLSGFVPGWFLADILMASVAELVSNMKKKREDVFNS